MKSLIFLIIFLHSALSDQISIDIVKLHNQQNDCWVIIKNKVHDVTKFIPRHPGGPSNIKHYCGKDATKAFGHQNHDANAYK